MPGKPGDGGKTGDGRKSEDDGKSGGRLKNGLCRQNNRTCGTLYEEMAAGYLQNNGLQILEKNFRTRYGEIDLIAKEGDTLVFAEIKYRRDSSRGYPQEAVGYRKQQKICRVSDYYRMQHRISEFQAVRFDVIGICGEELTWIRNAFAYVGR